MSTFHQRSTPEQPHLLSTANDALVLTALGATDALPVVAKPAATAPAETPQATTPPGAAAPDAAPNTLFGAPLLPAQALRQRWLPADPAGLVPLRRIGLPGPRREKESRGGATAYLDTIRTLIRSPLVHRMAALFPRQETGRPTPPAAYWLFYGALAREINSFSQADREIESHYDAVRAEFAAQGITLPAARPGTTNPVPSYAAYNRWRRKQIINAGLFPELRRLLTHTGYELSWLIRDAEGRPTGDPLNPSLGEILSGDATVFAPPSSVREEVLDDEHTGTTLTIYPGSRARPARTEEDVCNRRGIPRPHEQGSDYKEHKKHGPTQGFYHLALSTKGYATYTRVILDIDIAERGVAESTAAQPMLDRVLAAAPNHFQAIAYDGQIYPKHAVELMARHGVYVINHNSLRPGTRKDEGDGTDATAGISTRLQGHHKGKTVKTFSTPLRSQHHQRADRSVCTHHLVSDDGAVYPADRAGGAGTQVKTGPVITPTALRRQHSDTGYQLELEYLIACPHGDITYRAPLSDTKPTSDGRVAWSSTLAAHRVIPGAWEERFQSAFGARNQSESFFSWLERRYYQKDRVASWGRDAQLVDLLCAAILHNTEAWAHYAYRHGATERGSG